MILSYALMPASSAKGRGNPMAFLSAAVGQGDAAVLKSGMLPLPAAGKAVVAKLAR